MAKIVAGFAASHSPQLNIKPDDWHLIVDRDRSNPNLDFEALTALARPDIADYLTAEARARMFDACQVAIEQLRSVHRETSPDVVVIVGNDQDEMFKYDNMPTFAVYWGDTVWDKPRPIESLHPSQVPGEWAYHAEQPESYEVSSELALHVIDSLMHDEFDLAQLNSQPEGRSIGHSWTFLRRRVMQDAPVPIVPVMINSFYEPNQPTPKRSYDLGSALRRAIDSWDSEARVAVYISGGLSHFVVDEELDLRVIEAMRAKDKDALLALPEDVLVSGTAEIRNWLVGAGCFEEEPMELIEYQPAYRTEAMTGCGMGFVRWLP